MPSVPTYEELLESLQTAVNHPADTCWAIYRYLNAHYKEMSSAEARTLLATYTEMVKQPRPSLLHSCILSVALRMSEQFADFKLAAFLRLWGYPQNLRDEDRQTQTSSDGRHFPSLSDKVERAIQSYLLHHAEERAGDTEAIRSMVAVKMYETEKNGRKQRSIKLIGEQGEELLADSHLLPCKPWEATGKLFDVLIRYSHEGTPRIQEAVVSQRQVAEVFTPVIGYVDRIDAEHRHYHIYDSLSRHFVAEAPKIRLAAGQFVWFSPVIPQIDKFKSAIIQRIETDEEGGKAFGLLSATITRVDHEKDYFVYSLNDVPPLTPEGTITPTGTASLSLYPSLCEGNKVKLLLFLTRGKDKQKHNHVAKVQLIKD